MNGNPITLPAPTPYPAIAPSLGANGANGTNGTGLTAENTNPAPVAQNGAMGTKGTPTQAEIQVSTPIPVGSNGTIGTNGTEPLEDLEGLVSSPFPTDWLPKPMADLIKATAETEGVPEILPACYVLGVTSASIGSGLRVVSGPSRTTRGNLFILGSAESGTAKTLASGPALEPFREFEKNKVEEWEEKIRRKARAEKEGILADIDRMKKMLRTPKFRESRNSILVDLEEKQKQLDAVERLLVRPVFSVEDATIEKQLVIMGQSDETLASFSTDAGAAVNNILGRYNALKRTDDALMVKAYSGDRADTHRISREGVIVEHPCLTLMWFLQPEKLDTLFANQSLREGGFLPRCLVCHTRTQPRHIDRNRRAISPEVRQTYRNLIRSCLETYRIPKEHRTIRPTKEAEFWLNEHFDKVVDRRLTDLRDISIFASRWNEQAWRLAVVIHAGKYGAQACLHELEFGTAVTATKIADWFAAQQLEILEGGRHRARREKKDLVMELLLEKPEGITAKDLYRLRIVPDSAQAHKLLADLEAAGVLVGQDIAPPDHQGGRTKRLYGRGGNR